MALIAFATALLLASGLIQGASFAMIPYLARNPEEQATANSAVAQLGGAITSTLAIRFGR